ncbi:ABC transporter ATP-binding protein [Radicibacter daui]|uniref:ABC transporter ATP-binding protein n=1 Tax=Radicibacter daui TaxID=3064829 RepID=UPI004046AD15
MSAIKAAETVLSVRDLKVQVATPAGARAVVEGLSFDLHAGETICIAGESGSGKSMTALSVMRLLPEPMARIGGGEILFGERDLASLTEGEMRRLRGNDIAMIFQEPMTSLNPVLTIGRQLGEALQAHRTLTGSALKKAVVAALEQVRISEPERRLKQYPHELSGGMRQRVMIAMALALNPRVLIADEPTTALDVTVQAQILELIRDLQRERGTAVILITHDMGVVAEMADRVIVMNHGKVVEQGPVGQIFTAPKQPYTRELLAAVPKLGALKGSEGPMRASAAPAPVADIKPTPVPVRPVVEVNNLTVRFDIHGGLLQRVVRRVHAVEKISFSLKPGETLALVGESGCGKSTTGRALMGLLPFTGDVLVAGTPLGGLSRAQLRPVRRDIQMIFQDPYASLDPRMTVGDLVGEPLTIHGLASGSELEDRVAWLFSRVGLDRDHMHRHPHEFSGGQRQRICIARALSLSPRVIVADESVSALDVSVQARVLDLLQELQDEMGLSYLFISHDMAVVEQISHRVAVMYLGQIVETGTRAQVFDDPRHSYTRRLIEAVPIADPARKRESFVRMEGEIPSPVHGLDYQPVYAELEDIGARHLVAREAA